MQGTAPHSWILLLGTLAESAGGALSWCTTAVGSVTRQAERRVNQWAHKHVEKEAKVSSPLIPSNQ